MVDGVDDVLVPGAGHQRLAPLHEEPQTFPAQESAAHLQLHPVRLQSVVILAGQLFR